MGGGQQGEPSLSTVSQPRALPLSVEGISTASGFSLSGNTVQIIMYHYQVLRGVLDVGEVTGTGRSYPWLLPS